MAIIALDFDGTLVTHEYPYIGIELPNMLNVIKKLQAKGHQFILFTMRSGETLDQAVQWCTERNIKFFGINENPQQAEWSASRKVYAQHYIDDAAIGVPLVYPPGGKRPYVDWVKIEPILEDYLLL